jgi:hypothetical protein
VKTSLTPEKLVGLAAVGRAQADTDGPFVNPNTVFKAVALLRERGEEWAESVLMRRFTRRSLLFPALPWLVHGEIDTLILAAQAEWDLLATAAGDDRPW